MFPMQGSFLRHLSLVIIFAAFSARAGLSQSAPTGDAAKPGESNNPTAVGDVSSKDLAVKITEDWSTPSLKGSDLVLGYTLPAEMFHGEGYTREFIRVQWRGMDPVDLYIVKPAGVEKPPAIVYLYSYPFELDKFRDDAFCRFLTRNGVAAIGFESALTGGRYHAPRPMKQWFVSELKESLSTSAHDVQMILNYLATRNDVDMNRIGMFGDGSGASIAILAAAVDPRIKSLDLLDPWGDWPDWMAKSTIIPESERADFLKPEWLANVAPLDPMKWLPKLKTQTVRIQNVATVTVTPNEAKRKLEAAAPPNVEIVHYADAQAFKASTAGGAGFDWIKEQVARAGKRPHASGNLQSQNPPDRTAQSNITSLIAR